MTTNEIKAFFALKGLSLKEVAAVIEEDRTAVSHVIAYRRKTERIVKKLQRKYRIKLNNRPERKAA
jgi:hypothetical protein